MNTGDTPSTPTAAPATPAPAAPAAPAAPTTTPAPETTRGSDTPAPVTPTTFTEGFAQAEAKMKADADAKKAERAAKKAEAATKPPVEPTTMPATTDEPAGDDDDATGAEAGAETPSETEASAPAAPVKKPAGPIPFERHKQAVENARTKGAEDAVAEVIKHYPWVGEVDPREIAQGLALRKAIQENPAAVAQRLLARSGRPSAPGATAETLDVMPDPDLQTEDGKHKMYSEGAHKRSLALLARRLGEAFQAELEPLKAFVAEQRAVSSASQAERIVTDRVESLLKLPGAQEHLEEIVNLMERDGRLSDIGAYNRVVPPRLAEENARLKAEKAEADARFKAGAGTISPAGGGTGTTGKRTFTANTDGFKRALEMTR